MPRWRTCGRFISAAASAGGVIRETASALPRAAMLATRLSLACSRSSTTEPPRVCRVPTKNPLRDRGCRTTRSAHAAYDGTGGQVHLVAGGVRPGVQSCCERENHPARRRWLGIEHRRGVEATRRRCCPSPPARAGAHSPMHLSQHSGEGSFTAGKKGPRRT